MRRGNDAVAHGDAQPSPWVYDVLLSIGVALTVSWLIAANVGGTGIDATAYLWALGFGAVMLARRRYPVIVVALSAGAVVGYHASGYPPIGIAVPLAAAVFSAAEFGRAVAAIVASASVMLLSVLYRLAVGQDPGYVVGYELPGEALLLAAAVILGDSIRSRRELRRQAQEIAALTAERLERAAQQRLMAERLEIARELHDSVGHALTVVTLHTQVLEESLPADDPDVQRSLRAIADTTSATFADLRRTVLSLRSETRASRAPLKISDLGSATSPAREAGMAVTTRVEVRSALPPTVETAVYRIVQESITNVVKHTDASHVEVLVREEEGMVTISVVDDGRARPQVLADEGIEAGSGIAGMRERAQLLGGELSAQPLASGFAVRATIPVEVTP